jgi:CheY-like chemotaxis protein/anti-sigma regulatory factor (Ser/Thr protein kinase)
VTTVLVVDDNAIDRRLAARLVEKVGMTACFAENGQEALDVIERQRPGIVLTDMIMPIMDGLELVQRIKRDYPTLPVILMTAHGSEEIAVRALQIGAASYVPKQSLVRSLANTIRDVLAVAGENREKQRALAFLSKAHLDFVLGVQQGSHEPVVWYLQEQLRQWGLCSDADLVRVGTALHEAFVNAIEHGNLQLDSDLRNDPDGAYQLLGDQRRQTPPYCQRNVFVKVCLTKEAATITLRDEGPGFDRSSVPDPTDPERIGMISGRGLLLIQTFMDEVHFNERGNEITLIKRRAG